MRTVLIASLLSLLMLTANVVGFDLMNGHAIGMGRTSVVSRASAATLVNLPCGGLEPGGWRLEGGYNRRFELADLDQVFLAGAVRWRNLTVAMGASQFGKTDLYAEQLLKGSLACRYDSLTAGVMLSAMQVQIGNNYGTLRAATVGLGASWRTRLGQIVLTADNLTGPALTENSRKIQPVYSLHAEMARYDSYSITGRIRVEKLQKPQFSLGQLIRLSGRSSFFWGVGTEPLEYGGGIEISVRSGTISYATSVHPVLGFSHTVSFTYGSTVHPSKGDDFE